VAFKLGSIARGVGAIGQPPDDGPICSVSGKQRFTTRAQADKAIEAFIVAPNYDGRKLHSYKCQYCAEFHFGHKQKRGKA
jgi:hypothetical protein